MDVKDGQIRLISEVISSALGIDMSVLMGANVAKDVAQEDFCEATIGEHIFLKLSLENLRTLTVIPV